MNLEHVSLLPAGIPTGSSLPREMVDFARMTGCVRDAWQFPPSQPHKKFEKLEYDAIQTSLYGNPGFWLWQERCLDQFTNNSHQVIFAQATLFDPQIDGLLRLERIDEYRQVGSVDADKIVYIAGFTFHHNNRYWKIGVLQNDNNTLDFKVSTFYRDLQNNVRFDHMSSWEGTYMLVMLGRSFTIDQQYQSKKDQDFWMKLESTQARILDRSGDRSFSLSDNNPVLWSGRIDFDQSPFHGDVSVSLQDGQICVQGKTTSWIMTPTSMQHVNTDIAEPFDRLLGLVDTILPHWNLGLLPSLEIS